MVLTNYQAHCQAKYQANLTNKSKHLENWQITFQAKQKEDMIIFIIKKALIAKLANKIKIKWAVFLFLELIILLQKVNALKKVWVRLPIIIMTKQVVILPSEHKNWKHKTSICFGNFCINNRYFKKLFLEQILFF